MQLAVIVPNWNGQRWLPQCLAALAAQSTLPDELIVVDNGSSDGSLELVREGPVPARIIELGTNTGFAHAANVGIEAARCEAVALINTDIVLDPAWIERMLAVLAADERLAAVACKMLQLDDPTRVYDAGDILRRDGACEQRGRFERDDGRFERPEPMFAACAGAAVFRRSAVLEVGGFDTRFFSYLEDVDLGLRLQLAGWTCAYEPVVALHAGGGSSWQLDPPVEHWVQRNTVLVMLKAFPPRWLPYILYRQLGWAWHALLEGHLWAQLTGTLAAVPLVPAMLRERRRLRRGAARTIEEVVPRRPIRGARR
jgi:GT2 family glycosyltransferase